MFCEIHLLFVARVSVCSGYAYIWGTGRKNSRRVLSVKESLDELSAMDMYLLSTNRKAILKELLAKVQWQRRALITVSFHNTFFCLLKIRNFPQRSLRIIKFLLY